MPENDLLMSLTAVSYSVAIELPLIVLTLSPLSCGGLECVRTGEEVDEGGVVSASSCRWWPCWWWLRVVGSSYSDVSAPERDRVVRRQ